MPHLGAICGGAQEARRGGLGSLGGHAEHLDRVERVDRRVGLGGGQEFLEGEVVGELLAVLPEHADVALDDQAGVLLVEVVVAVGRELLEAVSSRCPALP